MSISSSNKSMALGPGCRCYAAVLRRRRQTPEGSNSKADRPTARQAARQAGSKAARQLGS